LQPQREVVVGKQLSQRKTFRKQSPVQRNGSSKFIPLEIEALEFEQQNKFCQNLRGQKNHSEVQFGEIIIIVMGDFKN